MVSTRRSTNRPQPSPVSQQEAIHKVEARSVHSLFLARLCSITKSAKISADCCNVWLSADNFTRIIQQNGGTIMEENGQ